MSDIENTLRESIDRAYAIGRQLGISEGLTRAAIAIANRRNGGARDPMIDDVLAEISMMVGDLRKEPQP